MYPENARIIAGQRWAELAHSRRRSRRRDAPPPPPPPAVTEPGVFLAGPDAFGFRSYLTRAEARKLAADWTGLLSQFADRVDDPALRPDGAVPFGLVVLGGPVPELAGVDD
ncbi:MAG TPA: hypothetical protein VIX86_23140 [Streptosporangiaceae bacterium]